MSATGQSQHMQRILKSIDVRFAPKATVSFENAVRPALSPYLYRARNLIWCFFNKIKHYRRIAPRYDSLAADSLAFLQLASIRL
jgi:transposase